MLQACDEAFLRGGCALADASAVTPPPQRSIRIAWSDSEQLAVHLELTIPGQIKPERVRDLSFLPGDNIIERWRSVGLVAGTLADESLLFESHSNPPQPPIPPPIHPLSPSLPGTPRPHPPRPRQATWLDGAFTTGPVLSRWQLGGALRGGHALGGALFTLVGVRYSELPRDSDGLKLRWLTTSVGMGLRTWPAPGWLEADFRLEILSELAQASALDSATGNVDASGRLAPGARIGADVGLKLSDWGQIIVGGDIAYTGRPIEVRVHSLTAGTVSPTTGMLIFGFRETFR